MDRATIYASSSRLIQGLGGIATLAAAAVCLQPSQQGVFFTIASFMQIQTAAEMGISGVLVQVASHESRGTLRAPSLQEGNESEWLRARIASLLGRSLAWTGMSAAALWLIMVPVGLWFFSSSAGAAGAYPWLLAASMAALNLMPMPILGILEGCGGVEQAWRIRMFQQLVGAILAPCALMWGLGSWALGVSGMGILLAGIVGLSAEIPFFQRVWKARRPDASIQWRTEVWPFQWRISLSYLSGIFIVHFAIPSIYRICGAVEAGRFGLSYTAMRAVSSVALSNVSTKAQLLGSLIAADDRSSLDRKFDASCLRSMLVAASGLITVVIGLPMMGWIDPRWHGRELDWGPATVLAAAMLLQHAVQCLAIYLRAHREEPLLWPSLIGAGLLGGGFPVMAIHWGVLGVCYWFFITTLVLGLGAAVVLVHRKRAEWKLR